MRPWRLSASIKPGPAPVAIINGTTDIPDIRPSRRQLPSLGPTVEYSGLAWTYLAPHFKFRAPCRELRCLGLGGLVNSAFHQQCWSLGALARIYKRRRISTVSLQGHQEYAKVIMRLFYNATTRPTCIFGPPGVQTSSPCTGEPTSSCLTCMPSCLLWSIRCHVYSTCYRSSVGLSPQLV